MSNGVRFPGVPPVVDDRVLGPTVRVLVQIAELLTGQRGDTPLSVTALQKRIDELERRVKALEA